MLRSRAERKARDQIAPEVYPTEPSEEELEDHALHVANEPCARCGRAIRPVDEARRTATGAVVHMSC